MALRPCIGCGRLCSGSRCGDCQPAQRTTAQRGYAGPHQAERARWKPIVDAGQACCAEVICLMPSRQIAPGEPWDLAHDRATGTWRGPAHRRCNRAEAARFVNRNRSRRWTTSRPW